MWVKQEALFKVYAMGSSDFRWEPEEMIINSQNVSQYGLARNVNDEDCVLVSHPDSSYMLRGTLDEVLAKPNGEGK